MKPGLSHADRSGAMWTVNSSIDEYTRVVQELLNMLVQGVLTKKQTLAAIKRVEYYKEILPD